MIRPELNPPVRGWLVDLPGPNDVPHDEPSLGGQAPNYLSDVYLELPRSFVDARGLMVCMNFIYVPFLVFCFRYLFEDFENVESVMLGVVSLIISMWIVLVTVRSDVSPPRDLPLRFNRLRRKMYAYEIDAVWWNPFIRWPVRAIAYNWDDVRAEAWQQQGAINGGHVMKWGVVLSVVKPGTNEVIDRFQLRARRR
ncbi:hypothetical protein LGM71_07855 [Burkholderia sp. AU33545]|uniref:DUF6708 domain-containing protein n=1 Tax=Burkholderia sp. AU33545 TaxID=2879631 RepID=UPI001CF3E688|nr:DUF6708 domain-containing protein [Burkholderia sp. AU33545]MCA8200957.1 hypothetical protein [Burkholderia sp. AU33545]